MLARVAPVEPRDLYIRWLNTRKGNLIILLRYIQGHPTLLDSCFTTQTKAALSLITLFLRRRRTQDDICWVHSSGRCSYTLPCLNHRRLFAQKLLSVFQLLLSSVRTAVRINILSFFSSCWIFAVRRYFLSTFAIYTFFSYFFRYFGRVLEWESWSNINGLD